MERDKKDQKQLDKRIQIRKMNEIKQMDRQTKRWTEQWIDGSKDGQMGTQTK